MKQPCFFGSAAHFCGMGSAKPICITPCPHGLERARSKVWSKGHLRGVVLTDVGIAYMDKQDPETVLMWDLHDGQIIT